MPHRSSSPVDSENEFDITESLFKDDDQSNEDRAENKKRPKAFRPPTEDARDIGLDLDDEEDEGNDELFIAARQAAANRKTSNVKGRSVKKGGGFQAMGEQYSKH